jgi:Ca-activated chloride channel family protein
VREAGTELFTRLRPDDVAAVGTFGRQIAIGPFTRDVGALLAALPRAIEEDAPTPLWRAITQAIDTFKDTPGRRVVLVISDGKDTPAGTFGQKYVGSFEVLDRAHGENVMIYAVAMRSRMRAGAAGTGPGGMMGRLTEGFPSPEFGKTAVETGGGYVELGPRDDLGVLFARIADELHSQYLLGFAPSAADGKRHEVDVRVSQSGLKVRARQHYVAPRSSR